MTKCKSEYCGCLYYSANALARVMTRLAEEAFAPTGLAPSSAFILMTVNNYPGIHPKELSEHMQLTPSTVTRLVEKLEFKGYLHRESSGRSTAIHPTSKSRELQDQIKTAWSNLYHLYSKEIGEGDGKVLTEKINQALEQLTE
jgi:DNA-binding MarR family transcriptional regulator